MAIAAYKFSGSATAFVPRNLAGLLCIIEQCLAGVRRPFSEPEVMVSHFQSRRITAPLLSAPVKAGASTYKQRNVPLGIRVAVWPVFLRHQS
jgi:hypothetical protein